MKKRLVALLVSLSFLAVGCAGHYVNKPIDNTKANDAYYETNPDLGGVTDDVHFILAFSGGGTRAAAMSYGVLKTLSQINVQSAQGEIRLLDEVDIISSVSGGSYTSAYYGLFGDRIFEDFEEKFLYANVQGMLTRRVLSPLYWPKYWSGKYGRSEMSAEVMDKILFEGKRYRDLIQPGRPIINVQATDATLGEKFTFSPSEFRIICSDLLDFPVSRAVVASSAVPIIFSSIVLHNHAGQCGYVEPEWARDALTNFDWDSRVDKEAARVHSYLDVENRPYLHLLDGGLTDNLGVRSYINRLFTRGEDEDTVDIDPGDRNPDMRFTDDDEAALVRHGVDDVKKVVYIVVNAEAAAREDWDRRYKQIGLMDTALISTSVGMSQFNFSTIRFLERRLEEWHLEMMEEHCAAWEPSFDESDLDELELKCRDIDTYLIYLDFDLVNDKDERKYFKNIPTAFTLEEEQVDKLIEVSDTMLMNSKELQRLIKDLNSRYTQ